MPPPGPHINAHEIDCYARQQPDVAGIFYSLPGFTQVQPAQRKVEKYNTDNDPKPGLPAFHRGHYTQAVTQYQAVLIKHILDGIALLP